MSQTKSEVNEYALASLIWPLLFNYQEVSSDTDLYMVFVIVGSPWFGKLHFVKYCMSQKGIEIYLRMSSKPF